MPQNDWRRVKRVEAVGRGLTDLALAKLVAGREKDLHFVEHMVVNDMIERVAVEARAVTLPVPAVVMALVLERIARLFTNPRHSSGADTAPGIPAK